MQYTRDTEKIVRQIKPHEIQINTPLRPCSIEPLGGEELSKNKRPFYQPHRNYCL